MDDSAIIRQVQRGNVNAYAILVRRYHNNLLSFIFRIIKDAHLAEDIGQEVFLKVYKQLDRFDADAGTPFVAWLYIVARNECISELRKRSRSERLTVAFSHGEATKKSDSAELSLIRQEETEALHASVQELPEPFRTTLILSLKGASLDEIAQKCGVPQSTVKSRLFRAKEKLMSLLKAHMGGLGYERRI